MQRTRERSQKPVETGAFRHYVPEIGPLSTLLSRGALACFTVTRWQKYHQVVVCLGEKYLPRVSVLSRVLVAVYSSVVSVVLSVHGMLADRVEDPVHLCRPAAVVSVVHLLHEVVQRLLLRLVQGQGLSDVGDVVKRLQLGHPRAQHHGEEVDEEVGVLPDCQVRLVTHLLEPEGGQRKINEKSAGYSSLSIKISTKSMMNNLDPD